MDQQKIKLVHNSNEFKLEIDEKSISNIINYTVMGTHEGWVQLDITIEHPIENFDLELEA